MSKARNAAASPISPANVASAPSTPRGSVAASSPATARASVGNASSVPDLDSTLQLPEKPNPTVSNSILTVLRTRPFNVRELREPVAKIEVSSSVAAIVSGAAKTAAMAGITAQTDQTVPEPIVDVESNGRTVSLLDPSKNYAVKAEFVFDYCFSPFVAIEFGNSSNNITSNASSPARSAKGKPTPDSDDDEGEAEKEQAKIFEVVGQPVVQQAFAGINTCIFSYGQTSSGKTYTMLGTKTEPGIVPRVCRALFQKIETDQLKVAASNLLIQQQLEGMAPEASPTATAAAQKETETKLEVVYMEIYNERVRDLLRPRTKTTGPGSKKPKWDVGTTDEEFLSLRVRQHPLHGPFVDGLTKLEVKTWIDCVRLIRQGNELRMTCTTDMNDSSSRSHAIFQILMTQTEAFGAKVRGKEIVNHRMSKINLVDLAGSERSSMSGAKGKHATEANYINTSLSTLRKVIDVLNSKKKMRDAAAAEKIVVPYRESLITWILSDNFGGNSRTAMIANVSPHWSCAQETESTLRYATLARGIVNRCRVNEDPSAKLIRELQTQLRNLQDELRRSGTPGTAGGGAMTREIEEQMEENKRALDELMAKENGMMEVIRESREREEKLRIEKESLERDQQRWKREAERLAKEKVELLARLDKLGEPNNAPRGAAFWDDRDRGAVEPPSPVDPLAVLKAGSRSGVRSSSGSNNFSSSLPSSPITSTAHAAAPGTPLNDSITCPPNQAKRAHLRRRASQLNPDDLTQTGSSPAAGNTKKDNDSTSATSSTFLTDPSQQHPQSSLLKPVSRESRNSRQSNRIDSAVGVERDPSAMLLGSLIAGSGPSDSKRDSFDYSGNNNNSTSSPLDAAAATAAKRRGGGGDSRGSNSTAVGVGVGGGGDLQPQSIITPGRLAGGSLLAQLGGVVPAAVVGGGTGSRLDSAKQQGATPQPVDGGRRSNSILSNGSSNNNFNGTHPSQTSSAHSSSAPITTPPPPSSRGGGNSLPISLQSPGVAVGDSSEGVNASFNSTGGSTSSQPIKSGRRKNA